LIERIAATSGRGGAHVVIASAGDSAPACASLTLARSLSRQGRAILLQTDDEDLFLREALEVAAGGACDATHPGLSHLLSGEASFADAIFRDDASRLHIVHSGGPVDAHSNDLSLILDALHATYDFVLIAAGADATARSLAVESDLTLIFAGDRVARDVLHDDFEASGVRAIVLAGLDGSGEIVEMAA
jgi:Mrp family chromosome partitioning ATPase